MIKTDAGRRMDSLLAREVPGSRSLLLHSCCAPCSSHVISLLAPVFRITVFYYNPNIRPAAEYEKRKAEQIRFLQEYPRTVPLPFPIGMLDCDYDAEAFLTAADGLFSEPEGGARCEKCFALRLDATAAAAKSEGFDCFATTLTVSPHKDAALINELGTAAGALHEICYLPSDFKKKNGYPHSIALSHEYHLYRQNYCGCGFPESKEEYRP